MLFRSGDIEPPPLASDVPPGFLDEEMAVYAAEPYEVKANWRLGCENGFDPSHHFIHNWSQWILNLGIPITFGLVASKEKFHEVAKYEVNEPGPKGFTRSISGAEMIMEASIPGRNGEKETKVKLPVGQEMTTKQIEAVKESFRKIEVGLWLPCGLKVFPGFPSIIPHEVYHYEFYVPKDEGTHHYFQFGAKRVKSAEEHDAWVKEEGHYGWEVQGTTGFTTEDVFAREGIEKFYSEEDGWQREGLYRPDIEITVWRKFASEQARGIQTREHVKGEAKR